MIIRLGLAAGAALLASCATAVPPPAPATHAAMPAPSAVVSTPIIRSGKTISGQDISLPSGPLEVVAARVDIQPGGALPIHKHPWSRYVYVESGGVQVVNHDTGATADFTAGQLIVEVIDQWHEARALGPTPTRLIVIDQVPPGGTNVVMKPAS